MYINTTQNTEPDARGPGGSLWEIKKLPEDKVAYIIGQWLLDSPIDPFWNFHTLSVVHLRGEIPGEGPPELFFDGATHEILCLAIDPNIKTVKLDWSDLKPSDVSFLSPPDFIIQIKADSDTAARKKIEDCLEQYLAGRLPPYSDFRESWTLSLGGVHAPTKFGF